LFIILFCSAYVQQHESQFIRDQIAKQSCSLAEAQQQTSPEQIGVGIHIVNLAEENLSEGSFYADFYLFLLKNPSANITQTECSGLTALTANNFKYQPVLVNAKSTPVIFNVSTYYRVMSRFYFELKAHSWPYDTQVYDIILELQDLPISQAQFCFMQDYTNISSSVRFAGRDRVIIFL
jgi:hypothetical protein